MSTLTQARFQCETCQRKFGDKKHLACHQAVHSNERPFICECSKAYKMRKGLNRHIRMKHPRLYEEMQEKRRGSFGTPLVESSSRNTAFSVESSSRREETRLSTRRPRCSWYLKLPWYVWAPPRLWCDYRLSMTRPSSAASI